VEVKQTRKLVETRISPELVVALEHLPLRVEHQQSLEGLFLVIPLVLGAEDNIDAGLGSRLTNGLDRGVALGTGRRWRRKESGLGKDHDAAALLLRLAHEAKHLVPIGRQLGLEGGLHDADRERARRGRLARTGLRYAGQKRQADCDSCPGR